MKKINLVLVMTAIYLSSCANDAQQRTNIAALKELRSLSNDAQAANGSNNGTSNPQTPVDPQTGASNQPGSQQPGVDGGATTNPNTMTTGTGTTTANSNSVKLTCPPIPVIASPVNPDGPTCGKECREKLRNAAAYVNALVTKPNIYVPGDDHLSDKITGGNIFNAINAAGNDAGRVYSTPCNPLAGIDYRK